MVRTSSVLLVAVAAIVVLASQPVAHASEWSSTEIQLLHGSSFELGDPSRDIITFNHVSGWRLGSNFFFFDVTQPFANGTEVYGEWYPRLSLGRLLDREPGQGMVKDLSLTLAINAGDDFRAYLAGTTVHFDVPGFAFFDLDIMAYDDRAVDGTTFIVTPAWERHFTLGQVSGQFRGFIDWIGAEGDRSEQLLAQPQLLVNVASLWGQKGRLWVGIEYQFWHNKYGLEDVDESFAQMMVMWQF